MSDAFAPVREHLKASRARTGLTQEELAEKARIPDDFVRDMESRRRNLRFPADWPNFRALCQAVGEDPAVVLKTNGML